MSWWHCGGKSKGLEGIRASLHDLRSDALQNHIRYDESTRTRLHRALNRLDILRLRPFGPRCIDRQHRLQAVTMLLGDPEGIVAEDQIPADRGVSGT